LNLTSEGGEHLKKEVVMRLPLTVQCLLEQGNRVAQLRPLMSYVAPCVDSPWRMALSIRIPETLKMALASLASALQ
jgi:hypothetical protein